MMINSPASSFAKKTRLKKAILLFLAPLLLASCATRMRIPDNLEPERLLPSDAMAYIRANPVMADELILPFIDPYGISQTEDMLKRAESMVLAVMPPSGIPDGQTGKPVVYGVVSGKFPTRTIAMKLNTDRHWVRQEPGWVHDEEGIHVAVTSGGQIIVGTASLESITTAGYDRPHPVPELWGTAWYNDLAVYIPDPFSLLGNSLPIDASSLSLESMLISTRKMDDLYEIFMGFEFATERTALVFAPLCRLFLYALARGLWPEQASEILSTATWSTQGFTVEAQGIRLDAAQMTSLLAMPFGKTMQARSGQSGLAK